MSDLPCPPYQDLATLARNLCAAETTIENLVNLGQFPKPKRLGNKRLWKWTEVCRHIDGPQDNTTLDLIGRIRDGAKREASRTERRVRDRHQGIPGVAKVSGAGVGNAEELPAHADPCRTP